MDALWGLGIVFAPIARFLDESFVPEVRWLDVAPFRQYFADPFARVAPTTPGTLEVYCEAYDYTRRRGHIVAFPLRAERGECFVGEPRVALAAPHHVSFPCLVEDGDELYCVPEQGATGRVTLYRRERRAPHAFVPLADLVQGFEAADPVLFRHGGLHWLFVTDRACGLHAFYANEIRGPFARHPKNPLRRDRGWTRAAGSPFVHEGRIFRAVQDGRLRYGGAAAITEIVTLDPEAFEERIVRRIGPFDRRFPLGLHTISAAGDATLIDGLRPSRVPPFARAFAGFCGDALGASMGMS
jgi:hypothetical protein